MYKHFWKYFWPTRAHAQTSERTDVIQVIFAFTIYNFARENVTADKVLFMKYWFLPFIPLKANNGRQMSHIWDGVSLQMGGVLKCDIN